MKKLLVGAIVASFMSISAIAGEEKLVKFG